MSSTMSSLISLLKSFLSDTCRFVMTLVIMFLIWPHVSEWAVENWLRFVDLFTIPVARRSQAFWVHQKMRFIGHTPSDHVSLLEIGFMAAVAYCMVSTAYAQISPLVKVIRRTFVVYTQQKTGIYSFEPERMMPGSSFEASSIPSFQAEVIIRRDGIYYQAGQGFLTSAGKYFVTAYHVVEGSEDVQLKTLKGEVYVSPDRFCAMDGDLVYMEITPQERSALNLSSAKLMSTAVGKGSGLFVQAVAGGQKSMGLLDKHEAFGYVTYKGSTIKGFSGSPYYVGKTVYGLHIGGSTENLGYDAAYISMQLSSFEEDSSKMFIEQALARGDEINFMRSPYDPEEYFVEHNGKYYVMEEEDLDDLRKVKRGSVKQGILQPVYERESAAAGSPRVDEDLPAAPRTALVFQDQENLVRAPAVVAGARGEVLASQEIVRDPLLAGPRLAGLLPRESLESKATAGPSQIPAVPSAPLDSTVKSIPKSARARRLRNLRQKIARLEQPSGLTRRGKSILDRRVASMTFSRASSPAQ
ncbi:hypothetical protein 1 [Hubei sobemo-like virus 8]|uniref:hypothetical protein 1 n=1 Tax=Hubei sobemo-like virus 8 TaxID=1923241 RepID=UPI00090A52AA|nr:hypothetical protein 1 [Hubei sobemo-like virus 8]APG75774.1 hypothetical protein 1 [Hubei sobemo-like virus 8]